MPVDTPSSAPAQPAPAAVDGEGADPGIAATVPDRVAWDDPATRRWHARMRRRGWWGALGCAFLMTGLDGSKPEQIAVPALAVLTLLLWALVLGQRHRVLSRHPWVPYLVTVIADGGPRSTNGILELRSTPDALPLRLEMGPGPWRKRFAGGRRGLVCGDERTRRPLVAVEDGNLVVPTLMRVWWATPGWTELGRAEHEVSADVVRALEAVEAGTVTARVTWRAATDPARHARGVVPEIGARPWRIDGRDDHGLDRTLDLEYHQGRIVVDMTVPGDAYAGDATDQPVACGDGASLRLRIARLSVCADWETSLPRAGEYAHLASARRRWRGRSRS